MMSACAFLTASDVVLTIIPSAASVLHAGNSPVRALPRTSCVTSTKQMRQLATIFSEGW